MIAQLIDKSIVISNLAPMVANLRKVATLLEQKDAATVKSAGMFGVTPRDLRNAAAELDAAVSKPPAPDPRQPAYIPSDAAVSLLQSSLEDHYQETNKVHRPEAHGALAQESPLTDETLRAEDMPPANVQRNLFERMEYTDIGWISCKFAEVYAKLVGRRDFNPNPAPPRQISDRALVVLVGDWASGVPRARRIGREIRTILTTPEAANRERHVIHLGDVYYSGYQKEYERHFLEHWPVKEGEEDKINSWCLNGNHDMYSGGHAYYDFLLAKPLFKGQSRSSFFSLANTRWQILGLDTAYTEYDLHGGQAQWVRDCVNASPNKKTMLLSHHQLFSAYDKGSVEMEKKLKDLLDNRRINTWFWGHEHRCTVYEPAKGITFPRCIGHGGVPVWADTSAKPNGVRYAFQDSFGSVFEKFARFGFAVLDFQDDVIKVRYINESGNEHYSEEIR